PQGSELRFKYRSNCAGDCKLIAEEAGSSLPVRLERSRVADCSTTRSLRPLVYAARLAFLIRSRTADQQRGQARVFGRGIATFARNCEGRLVEFQRGQSQKTSVDCPRSIPCRWDLFR